MNQDNEKEEPSVDEILSSIKDVIANDKDESIDQNNASVDDNVFELTDIIEDADDESQDNNDSISEIFEGGDISIDNVIKEAVKESIEDWFSRNLRPIVEESVKQEISKLFKKRN
tara:strand:- start:217 stop:561 length:345 start_codon:yes stop_codon:yes gene_type:complete